MTPKQRIENKKLILENLDKKKINRSKTCKIKRDKTPKILNKKK